MRPDFSSRCLRYDRPKKCHSINQSIKLLYRLYPQRTKLRGAQILGVIMCHSRSQSRFVNREADYWGAKGWDFVRGQSVVETCFSHCRSYIKSWCNLPSKWNEMNVVLVHLLCTCSLNSKLGHKNLLRMVRWMIWHCPPDTGFEIRSPAVWCRARYLSS